MAGSMRYRRRVADPDVVWMQRFAAAVDRMQGISDNRGYAYIAGLHGAPGWYCWHHQFSSRSDNRAQLFLPWHRAYLHRLDLLLNDLDAEGEIAQPWWDWTRTTAVPEAYRVSLIAGNANPLRRFRMDIDTNQPSIHRNTRRNPGGNPFARLPTKQQVEAVLADTDWSSFSDRLQDLHDSVHGWVDGDMGNVTTAAYDPVFYAHHCMIDRIWYLWQVRHGINNFPDSLRGMVLEPFSVTAEEVLDTRALGYEYADATMLIEPAEPVVVG